MIVTLQQLQMGVTNYIETEIAAKATGFSKFAIYFVLPKISSKIVDIVNSYKDNPMTKDFFADNGNVNLDEVYKSAKSAISKTGQFTLYGIIFNESDVDKLYEIIKTTR